MQDRIDAILGKKNNPHFGLVPVGWFLFPDGATARQAENSAKDFYGDSEHAWRISKREKRLKSGRTEFVHGLTEDQVVGTVQSLLPPQHWPHQGFEYYRPEVRIGRP